MADRRRPAVNVAVAYLDPLVPVPVYGSAPVAPPESYVIVRRVGGPRMNAVTDGPMLVFECWHPDDAEDLAGRVMDALENASAQFVDYIDADGSAQRAWITNFQEVGAPAQNPDPSVPDSDRWTLTVRLGISTNL